MNHVHCFHIPSPPIRPLGRCKCGVTRMMNNVAQESGWQAQRDQQKLTKKQKATLNRIQVAQREKRDLWTQRGGRSLDG